MRTEMHDPNIGLVFAGHASHSEAADLARTRPGIIITTEHISCAERLQFVVDYNGRALALGSQRIDITRIL